MRIVTISYNMDKDITKATWGKEFLGLEFTWSNGKTTSDYITQLDAIRDAINILEDKYMELYERECNDKA